MIHSTVVIDPSAKIELDVNIGPYTVIGSNVEIQSGTTIDSHVVIECNTKIGKNNHIFSFAALGGEPQDLSYRGEDTWLEIGDNNIIREYVTMSRGSVGGKGITRIGDKNCLLAYSHVAHDCQLGNEILLVNNATMAGHVVVEDFAILGAFTAAHQHCRIGAYSFLSRATEISKDIPPYMLVKGIPGVPCGLNSIGLKRRGFTDHAITGLKRAYKLMYRRNISMKEACGELEQMAQAVPEIHLILDFIKGSKRGIARQSYDELQDNYALPE